MKINNNSAQQLSKPNNENTRDSGIELLRIVVMFCIVIHHLIDWGGGLIHLETLNASFATNQKLFLFPFVRFVNDCFVFISGYYLIKFDIKRIITLWLQCFFYYVTILIICKVFILAPISNIDFINSFIPFYSGRWWFVTAYFCLILLSPILNYFIKGASKSMFLYILIFTYIVTAYTKENVFHFSFLYLLASFIRVHLPNFNLTKKQSLLIYIISSIIVSALVLLSYNFLNGKGISVLWNDKSPFMIISAIAIFFFFKNIKFKSIIINSLGTLAFGVYLIHVHPLIIQYILPNIFGINDLSGSSFYIFYLFFFALLIFIPCLLIEKIRASIMNPILKYIFSFKFWENKIFMLPTN